MADPKIKYDIEAAVKGNADVNQLASEIDKLAGTLDGDLKVNALTAAEALRQLGAKDAALQNFADLKREAKDAAVALQTAQAAAQKLGAELSSVETPTRAQTGQMQKLKDAVAAAKAEVTASTAAVMQARTGLEQYGISTANLSQKQAAVKAAIAAAKTEIEAMAPAWQKAASGAADSANKQVQSAKQVETGLESLKNQLTSLRNIAIAAMGGSYVGSLAKDVAETADSYNNLQARIKLATGETVAFTPIFEAVSEVAFRTNSALESTGNLFGKLTEAGKSSGQSTQAAIAQSLKLTETIGQAIQLSGASQQASDAAITQLIQGLQSGVLRGDEFNSVMEQSPRLAKALADGLGTTTGELRKMAEAGQLTSDVVIKSLRGQSDVVAAEFAKLPPTVGRAIQNLSTAWTIYVGETDKATGASSTAARAIGLLSGNLKTVADLLLDAGQAAAAFVALRLAQHYLGIGAAATQATAAVVANTAAVNAASAASGGAAVNVGRFASILASLKTFTLLGIITNYHDIGTAIGEAAARLMGYKDRTKELIEIDKQAALVAAENAKYRQKVADANEAARESQLGLTKATKAATLEFDALVAKGNTAAEAIAKIGKDFDLSKSAGIRDAGVLLNNLAATGKLTAAEFKQAWSDALKGINLAEFEVKAQKAFGSSTDGVLRLKQALDATLREAINRTGLDFDVISGGMSKASVSAIGDTDLIIKGLDRLKAMGVDTGAALTASIGKGIDTADSQKAIDAVRAQIESVRKALGDKVADGLLDQAKNKATELADALDKAKPGVNSLREAMAALGVTSDQTFKDTAAKSAAAYQAMKDSGTASIRELRDGFKKYADDAIAASGGVASEALKAEAAMRGIDIAADGAGRAIVASMGNARGAVRQLAEEAEGTSKVFQNLNDNFKNFTKNSTDGGSATGMMPLDKISALRDKVQRGQSVDMTQAEYDAAKKQAEASDLFIRDMGPAASPQAISDNRAMLAALQSSLIHIIDKAGNTATPANAVTDKDKQTRNNASSRAAEVDNSVVTQPPQSAVSAARQSDANQPAPTRQQSVNDLSTPVAHTYTVNVPSMGSSIQVASDADAQALIGLFQRAKLSA